MLALVTLAVYAPGLSGGFLFDDYPNIVDNSLVQPARVNLSTLVAAALSSPSSDLKRPLSSLSFALNYVMDGGLDAVAMKCTNLFLHILNGVLLYILLYTLLSWLRSATDDKRMLRYTAGAMALAWLLAPINLSAVLYVVQRMESLANLFVLVGLIGFVRARVRMLRGERGFLASIAWTIVPAIVGVLAKETAVLLPLYAFCLELLVFRFRRTPGLPGPDRRFFALYALVLGVPIVAGLAFLGPRLLDPASWATRDFTLHTRLLSECRIVLDYIQWTVLPRPADLGFYHDDFVQSTGWLEPATTLLSALVLGALAISAWLVRRRAPLIALGIAWFLACHTLTGTVLPLELIYEHRNYFASIGVVLAAGEIVVLATKGIAEYAPGAAGWRRVPTLLAGVLMLWSAVVTAKTAAAWGNSLRLAETLAERGPDSPRAQYELGRTYIIASHYEASSPYADLAYAPLERAALLPGSSILPQQALIFLNARMDRPVKDVWWDSMVTKLSERPATVQDESSLDALSRCLAEQSCHFEAARLEMAMNAALNHPAPTGRMFAIAATFARRSLDDEDRAYFLQKKAVNEEPGQPVYRLRLAQMALDRGDREILREQVKALESLNVGGRLDRELFPLRLASAATSSAPL